MLFGLNGKQLIGISIVIVSALMVSTTQLTDLFGPGPAKAIGSASSILNLILGGVVALIGGNSSEITNVGNAALNGNPSAQRALISATANIARTEGDGIAKEAANTLIAATISLPQVDKILTQPDTAQASPSSDVISSDQVKVIENSSGKEVTSQKEG